MCAAAISIARIRRLYFGAYDPKGEAVIMDPGFQLDPSHARGDQRPRGTSGGRLSKGFGNAVNCDGLGPAIVAHRQRGLENKKRRGRSSNALARRLDKPGSFPRPPPPPDGSDKTRPGSSTRSLVRCLVWIWDLGRGTSRERLPNLIRDQWRASRYPGGKSLLASRSYRWPYRRVPGPS